MENIIEVNHLTCQIEEKLILNDITFSLKKGDFLCIVGAIGSGKSTLERLLFSNTNKKIKIDKNLKMEYIPPIFPLEGDTVYQYLETTKSIEKINDLAKQLGILKYLDCKPSTLSYGIQCLLQLMKSLLKNPDVLFLDSILDGLDTLSREKILKFLKKLNCTEHITIIYATENTNDLLFFKKIMILNQGSLYYFGTLAKAFSSDEIWKNSNLPYPFEVELSKKLKYYGLVDEPLFSIDKLVNTLWK